MPFIEDENGLAIYFTREQWHRIYRGLDDEACWGYTEEGAPQYEIISRIAKHLGLDEE